MVVLNDLKNNNKINVDRAREPIRNHFNSPAILSATRVLIKGSPLMCVLIFVSFVKAFVSARISLITFKSSLFG